MACTVYNALPGDAKVVPKRPMDEGKGLKMRRIRELNGRQ